MNYIPMTCGNCDFNDGVIYTSLPPKSKCTITNEFYECDHKCHLVFTAAEPVKHGYWLWVDGVRCSICNYKLQTTGLPNYCPNCGAKMDEVTSERRE